jgi:hypothetical protein
MAAADQPGIREGLVGRATRAGRDQRRTVAGEAGDAVDAGGLNGLGEGHGRQDGGKSPGQHRRARPWGTKKEDVVGRTPASRLGLQRPLGMPTVTPVNPPWKWEQQWRQPHDSSSSSALASCRSVVSKPSVNQL